MRRPARILTAVAVIALALAPALSEARPGGGASSGSRGSRSYSAPPSTQTAPGSARQFDRTQSAPSSTTNPGFGANAARPAAAQGGGFFSRNPLMAGLAGGLLGAGLFGLLGGGSLFGGMGGFASIIGLLLQIALIGGIVFLVMRFFRSRRPAMAGGPNAYARDMQPQQPARPMSGGAAPMQTSAIQVTEADFQQFEQALVAMNAAWSRQDLEALRRISTPEMTNYFAQDLNELRQRGWTNTTADVRLESGDLSEAWQENGQDYATVAMRFSLIDVTRDQAGKIVEGNATTREIATELWTFTRYAGDAWKVSAIQQTN